MNNGQSQPMTTGVDDEGSLEFLDFGESGQGTMDGEPPVPQIPNLLDNYNPMFGTIWNQHPGQGYVQFNPPSGFQPGNIGSQYQEDPEDLALTPPQLRSLSAPPAPKAGFDPHGKDDRKNSRFDPSSFYTPLSIILPSWGYAKRGFEPPFRYTKYGELHPEIRLTPQQVLEFIYTHPSRASSQSNSLTIYLQTQGLGCAKRYPNNDSTRCRFSCCPVSRNSIRHGAFRLAFVETFSRRICPRRDPYHNAFYVHLNCAERFLNLPELLRAPSVKLLPDVRHFSEGKNQMALNRSFDELVNVFYKFKAWTLATKSRPNAEYVHSRTLTYALTKQLVKYIPKNKSRSLVPDGGNTVRSHMGDLVLLALVEKDRKEVNFGNMRKYGTRSRTEIDEMEAEEMENDDEEEDEEPEQNPRKRLRY